MPPAQARSGGRSFSAAAGSFPPERDSRFDRFPLPKHTCNTPFHPFCFWVFRGKLQDMIKPPSLPYVTGQGHALGTDEASFGFLEPADDLLDDPAALRERFERDREPLGVDSATCCDESPATQLIAGNSWDNLVD